MPKLLSRPGEVAATPCTMGFYIELCDFFGWDDASAVLQRRAATMPKGIGTLVQTPKTDMLDALLKAQVKAELLRGNGRRPEPAPELEPEPEELPEPPPED